MFIVYDYIYNIQAAVDQLTDFYAENIIPITVLRNMLITAIKRMQEVEEFSLKISYKFFPKNYSVFF